MVKKWEISLERKQKVRREVVYGNSRFDLYIESGERKIFMEVKGVTLEENNDCKISRCTYAARSKTHSGAGKMYKKTAMKRI